MYRVLLTYTLEHMLVSYLKIFFNRKLKNLSNFYDNFFYSTLTRLVYMYMIVIVHQSLAYDKREFGFKGTDSATSRNNFDLLKYT